MASKHPALRRLKLLGEIIRIGKTSVLVKAYSVPRLASKVYDGKGREIGYVSNVFGPVSSPFVSLKVIEGKDVAEGDAVYIEKA
ncbi:MAG: hypothetical protein RMI49_05305 [Candidatus Caldarchaeum sp.]|nr:hypothetical protein [Candidatus Caldarchaeum sp.]